MASELSGNFIGGRWTDGKGDAITIVDPATEQELSTLRGPSGEQIETAVGRAVDAQRAFERWSAPARGQLLRDIALVIEGHAEELAQTVSREVGKPLGQARGEVAFSATYFRYMAEWDRRIEGELLPGETHDETIALMRVPIGVVAVICPWNFPVALFARKVAPALLTGNAVVVKPSEITPLATTQLVGLLADELVLPPGLLNLVVGDGRVGHGLVTSSDVAMVTFTGHRDTGKKIMAAASANLTRVSLELGGKAPVIIARDADLKLATDAVIAARHTNTGQVCTCPERVFVVREVYDSFVSMYVDRVSQLRMGRPEDDLDLGPLVSAKQLRKAEEAVERARAEKATVVTGGVRPSGSDVFKRGYWFSPTVLTDVRPDMQVMCDETFAPITPVMQVASVAEALALANGSRYGLSAYLFTEDYGSAMRLVRDVKAGEIYLNRIGNESYHAFHNGHRDSGIGGEDGKHGVLAYTQLKSVYLNFADRS
jgi:lactaldehyde dehydrogenase/glycolaldehyde dehydrogenase